jgi:alanyl-tRNA synthetase
MNALELSDKLHDDYLLSSYWLYQDSANMLRQQAKEIEQLKQIVEGTIKQAFYEDDYHKLKEKFDEQAKEIEQLTITNQDLKYQLIKKAKEIEDFRFVLRNLTLATSKKIGDLEEELENCTCQCGHSEAYLKVKGKL